MPALFINITLKRRHFPFCEAIATGGNVIFDRKVQKSSVKILYACIACVPKNSKIMHCFCGTFLNKSYHTLCLIENALLHYVQLHYFTLHYFTLHYFTLHNLTLNFTGDEKSMNGYVNYIAKDSFDGLFYRAVLKIMQAPEDSLSMFRAAHEYINKARDLLSTDLAALASESYSR